MAWDEQVFQGLKANEVKLVSYVPDGVLANLINMLEADEYFRVVPVTREEEAVGVLSGGYLGGTRGALLMQSSGLGNSINALASLSISEQIPFLMLISVRGDMGDALPTHGAMGRVLEPILDIMAIRHISPMREEEVLSAMGRMCLTAFRGGTPVAMLLKRELTGGKGE